MRRDTVLSMHLRVLMIGGMILPYQYQRLFDDLRNVHVHDLRNDFAIGRDPREKFGGHHFMWSP